MTFDEFLLTPAVVKFKQENLQRSIEDLNQMTESGGYVIANNLAVLTALANQNMDHFLKDYYDKVVSKG